MRTTFLTACAWLCASLLPLPAGADPYIWDNQNGNGIWNDPANWGTNNNPGYNREPTAADVAIFRSSSPGGVVTLTNNGFAEKIRQNVSASARTIGIGPGEYTDRALTLSGTSTELFDCAAGTANLTLDGAANAHAARLKLVINGTQTACPVNGGMSLLLNCDVSGTNGISLNAGSSGSGSLALGGANTYTGPTTVNAGTLGVNGSLAGSSAVTVNSGGTLAGSGVINGPVLVNAGATLSPGVSVGTLALNGGLTLSGNLLIQVNKSLAPSNDLLTVNGILTNAANGTLTVINLGPSALSPGDSFRIFSQPLPNGQALRIIPVGSEVWTNKLAVDGSIAVLGSTNPPPSGDPTTAFTWNGAALTNQNWGNGANWIGGTAPRPLSSNIVVFQGDIKVPYNWPYVDTNYGTTILIFSNNVVLNGIKILAGIGHTMNLGSYVLEEQPPNAQSPSYFGIDSPIEISYQGITFWVTNANFTNALGDASVGGQTDFRCTGGRLDVYGVLKDGAGAHSRLVKSGDKTLNITGMHANTYTGGTLVNAGPIKMQKPPGINAIPGDVTVNGSGSLIINIIGGEQIADDAVVTLNDSAAFDMIGQPETVRSIQTTNPGARIANVNSTLTVAPLAVGIYNSGVGESGFAGSISGTGTLRMNGSGTYGMLGGNSVANLTVNTGTLKVNGNSGTGAVTVNAGGTLLGQGTIAGAVAVAAGGTFGAGFGVGMVTLSAGLDLGASGGATNTWELAALKDSGTGVAGSDFDQVILSGGALVLGAQSTLDIRFTGSATAPDTSNPFWRSAHAWRVISLGGGSNPGASTFSRIRNGSYAAGNFTTAADVSGNIVLSFAPSAAPTPAARPSITFITNAGPGSMTVRYTNTLAGTNYALVYATNLPATNWYPAGTRTAPGTSDSQTDNSATNNQRYYRVYYP